MTRALTSDAARFAWERRVAASAFAQFRGLFAAAHAFCFYLFQIVYPPTAARLRRLRASISSFEHPRKDVRFCVGLRRKIQRSPRPRSGRPMQNLSSPSLHHVPSYPNMQPALKSASSISDLRARVRGPGASAPCAHTKSSDSARSHHRNVFE